MLNCRMLFLLFLSSITHLSLQAADTTSLHVDFNASLNSMQQVAEKNMSEPMQNILRYSISAAQKDFLLIAQSLEAGQFESLDPKSTKKILKAFEALHKIVSKIKNTKKLKPRHVRWFAGALQNLENSIKSIKTNSLTTEMLSGLTKIAFFCQTMRDKVCWFLAGQIGTRFEKIRDFLVHRPFEFYKRNWWWTVPTTLATAKVSWDSYWLADNSRVPVDRWNLRTQEGPPSPSWYKLFLTMVAGSLFASKFKDGFVKSGGVYVGKPVGASKNRPEANVLISRVELERENDDSGQVNQRRVREVRHLTVLGEYIVRQLPGLGQWWTCDCGYYALYNALCLKTDNLAGLVDREAFDIRLRRWIEIVRENARRNNIDLEHDDWLRPELLNILIEQDVGQLRSEEDVKSLADNVSLLEKDTVDPALVEVDGGLILDADRARGLGIYEQIQRFRNFNDSQIVLVWVSNHWLAFKLSWENDIPVITVVNSSGTDTRFHTITTWLYHLFCVQEIVEPENG